MRTSGLLMGIELMFSIIVGILIINGGIPWITGLKSVGLLH
jgi:hypothetical protein